jgi:colicin import membrane protein
MAASKQDAPGSPYRVPPEPNRWPSIGLAVGVHALLLAFLWIGVSWQNNAPVAVEAEIWDVTTQTAAPPPPPPPPPQAEPEPEPETPPQPVPRAVPPPEPVERPVEPKQPDIALEREKKRKEELKKRKEEERVERERERERELAEEKRAEEKKAKALAEKQEREALEKQKLKDEQKQKELAKKEEADKKKKADKEKAEKAEKAEKLAKEKAEKAEKEKAEKAENAKLAKLRDAEMKRLMAGAGNPGSTGSAEKSTAPRIDKGYTAAITAKVKGNTSYAGDTDEPGNPTATFIVQQLPTGEIISVKKTKSSGVPAFDDAVEKGIAKSSPLPKKKDGTVEKTLEINFHMKDLQ